MTACRFPGCDQPAVGPIAPDPNEPDYLEDEGRCVSHALDVVRRQITSLTHYQGQLYRRQQA